MLGARRVLDVGCFTGYSALAVASALGEDVDVYTVFFLFLFSFFPFSVFFSFF